MIERRIDTGLASQLLTKVAKELVSAIREKINKKINVQSII